MGRDRTAAPAVAGWKPRSRNIADLESAWDFVPSIWRRWNPRALRPAVNPDIRQPPVSTRRGKYSQNFPTDFFSGFM